MLVGTLVVSGCSVFGRTPDARAATEILVAAMASGDFSQVPAAAEVDIQAEWDIIMSGMDQITPQVSIDEVELSEDQEAATANLTVEWPFEAEPWSYPTTATFQLIDQDWTLQWRPELVHPSLSGSTRLTHHYLEAERADILGAGSVPIVTSREVLEVGLDKHHLGDVDTAAPAHALATLLGINPENYAARVAAAGPQAFVIALVIRGTVPHDVPDGLTDISGARALPSTRVLAPTREFAQGILGVVGPVDQETIDASGGRLGPGDSVGISGLQSQYETQLRGTPGHQVVMVDRPAGETPAPNQSADAAPTRDQLFRSEPTRGEPLQLTMDVEWQSRAEETLADVGNAASLVVLDRATGAILAAANGTGDEGNPNATLGHYPPGSTFKPVTALALVRKGLSATSEVECANSFTVEGRQFTNYSGLPANETGPTTLARAMAWSCNTALISQHAQVTPDDLSAAAASLGLGQDYDAGFPVFYGSVPPPLNTVGQAESMIGQGLVEASPVAMAGMAASIASGATVLPYLIEGKQPEPGGTPLSAKEATELQSMLEQVVTNGTGQSLQGVLDGAKTGTAEYGTENPPKTHAWMVGWDDEVAVAAFVADGGSGSSTAGPLIRQLLS